MARPRKPRKTVSVMCSDGNVLKSANPDVLKDLRKIFISNNSGKPGSKPIPTYKIEGAETAMRLIDLVQDTGLARWDGTVVLIGGEFTGVNIVECQRQIEHPLSDSLFHQRFIDTGDAIIRKESVKGFK